MDTEDTSVLVRFRKNDANHKVGDIASFSSVKAKVLVRAGLARYVDKRLVLRLALQSPWKWVIHPIDSFLDWYQPAVYADFEDGRHELIAYRPKLAVWLAETAQQFKGHGPSLGRQVLVGVAITVIGALLLAVIGLA